MVTVEPMGPLVGEKDVMLGCARRFIDNKKQKEESTYLFIKDRVCS